MQCSTQDGNGWCTDVPGNDGSWWAIVLQAFQVCML